MQQRTRTHARTQTRERERESSRFFSFFVCLWVIVSCIIYSLQLYHYLPPSQAYPRNSKSWRKSMPWKMGHITRHPYHVHTYPSSHCIVSSLCVPSGSKRSLSTSNKTHLPWRPYDSGLARYVSRSQCAFLNSDIADTFTRLCCPPAPSSPSSWPHAPFSHNNRPPTFSRAEYVFVRMKICSTGLHRLPPAYTL